MGRATTGNAGQPEPGGNPAGSDQSLSAESPAEAAAEAQPPVEDASPEAGATSAGSDQSLSAEAPVEAPAQEAPAATAETEAKKAPARKDALVTATVSPRRTVWIGTKQHGPGATVRLPADEVRTLRRSGFLVDPDAGEESTEAVTAINGESNVVRPK